MTFSSNIPEFDWEINDRYLHLEYLHLALALRVWQVHAVSSILKVSPLVWSSE